MVTFWAIWKNITFQVKTVEDPFWAIFRKTLASLIFQHLITLLVCINFDIPLTDGF